MFFKSCVCFVLLFFLLRFSGNRTSHQVLDVGLLCFIRKTADVIPSDIDKACGVTEETKEKCVRTVIYKSMCSRVIP